MIIRPERKDDFAAIYELVRIAFQTAKVSSGKEQDFVDKVRAGTSYIPELALVAEENGELLGHIMLTIAAIDNGGKKFPALLVAPLAVALPHRGRGIGAALMKEGLARASGLGHSIAVLAGAPDYYARFGFKAVGGIEHDGVPGRFVLVLALRPGALSGVVGKIIY